MKIITIENIVKEATTIANEAFSLLELEELWENESITEAQLSFISELEGA